MTAMTAFAVGLNKLGGTLPTEIGAMTGIRTSTAKQGRGAFLAWAGNGGGGGGSPGGGGGGGDDDNNGFSGTCPSGMWLE